MWLSIPLIVFQSSFHYVTSSPLKQAIKRYLGLDDATLEALQVLGRRLEDYREPGTLPYPHPSPGTDIIPGIKHIVMLMIENHFFDNTIDMLGRGYGFTFDRSGYPIETQPGLNGTIQKMFSMPNTCQLLRTRPRMGNITQSIQ